VPDNLKQLREDFVRRFPKEKLSKMTLEEYAGEYSDENFFSFCHWLKFKTKDLGDIHDGNNSKFGVYWNRDNQKWEWNRYLQSSNAQLAFKKLKDGLVQLIEKADLKDFSSLNYISTVKYFVRTKTLYLYFPEEFLPIIYSRHTDGFLKYFNQTPQDNYHDKNRQLLIFLKSQPEFSGFDTLQMMRFLYRLLPQREQDSPDVDIEVISKTMNPQNLKSIQHLLTITKLTKNLILYGSPGTGKTFTVNEFAKFFLDNQLQSPITPKQLKLDVMKGMTWHDAIALAIYVNFKSKNLFKVPKLVEDELIQTYWKTTKTQKLSNMIHAMLQIHTDVEVETVKYGISKRQPPYLFEKTQDGFWFLTDLGKEYV
jgi:5-methylcytosine-specific restriction protein B